MIDTLVFWWIWLTGLAFYLSIAGGAAYVLADAKRRARFFSMLQLAQNIANSYAKKEEQNTPIFRAQTPPSAAATVRMTPPPASSAAEEKKIN